VQSHPNRAGVKLLAFDLDDTLAPSKSKIAPQMADLLAELSRYVQICVISGGRFEQFQTQVLEPIDVALGKDARTSDLDQFHLMPTCGTQYYEWIGDKWSCIYAENLSQTEKTAVIDVLTLGARQLGLWTSQVWGPRIEDRGSQVTFSALGQLAPTAAKSAWDPSGSKKERLRSFAADLLPDLEVRSGGSTSVDVTRKGVDKAYGMRRIVARLGITNSDVLFVGDRLDPGGNDYPVKAMGIDCFAVSQWEETAAYVDRLVDEFRQIQSDQVRLPGP
jgi:phosphomannomutase